MHAVASLEQKHISGSCQLLKYLRHDLLILKSPGAVL